MRISLEEKVGVCVAGDLLIALGVDDLLDLLVDEVIKGVDMLLHQSSHLQSVHHALMLRRTGCCMLLR